MIKVLSELWDVPGSAARSLLKPQIDQNTQLIMKVLRETHNSFYSNIIFLIRGDIP